MSKYFVEEETEGTINMFNKRFIYKATMHGSNHNNIVSFIDGEKIYYGRINRKFIPINVSRSALKRLPINADSTRPLESLNFVADMFEQLCTQFQKAYAQGRLNISDPYLGSLKAYKAYEDPRAAYEQHRKIFFAKIENKFRSENINVRNFDEFMQKLMPMLENSIDRQPFTYTGFIKSRNCTVMNTGLAIEIADLEYTNDAEKIINFRQSKNWEYFVNTCDTYGFMVDYNVPWRIVADIGSDAMIEAARNYGYANVESILTLAYGKASVKNLKFFNKRLLELYNTVKKAYNVVSHCDDGSVIQKRVIPKTYTYESFVERYGQEYFLMLYMRLRTMEEQPDMSKSEIDRMINKELQIFRSRRSTNSLHENFESVINKTYHKNGSLTNAVRSDRLRKESMFEKGELDTMAVTEGGNDISGY